jgi:hypothetical protein
MPLDPLYRVWRSSVPPQDGPQGAVVSLSVTAGRCGSVCANEPAAQLDDRIPVALVRSSHDLTSRNISLLHTACARQTY